ncbi:MAG: hypothetical protein ACRC6E_06445 [Fusobacteriaceae bacterium]
MTNEMKEYYLSNNYSELNISFDGTKWIADDGIDIGEGTTPNSALEDLMVEATERTLLDWKYDLNEQEGDYENK